MYDTTKVLTSKFAVSYFKTQSNRSGNPVFFLNTESIKQFQLDLWIKNH